MIGLLIGPNGVNIAQLRNRTKCYVSVSKENSKDLDDIDHEIQDNENIVNQATQKSKKKQ